MVVDPAFSCIGLAAGPSGWARLPVAAGWVSPHSPHPAQGAHLGKSVGRPLRGFRRNPVRADPEIIALLDLGLNC